jgi:hypothetical protein
MIIDHIGMVFFPDIVIFRIIGRLSFPIFAWLIANGAIYTSDIRKYMFRLFVFAGISQLPYFLVMQTVEPDRLSINIFVTLFFGLLGIYVYKKISYQILSFILIVCICVINELILAGYGAVGILSILGFYIFRDKSKILIPYQIILFTLPYLSTNFTFVSTQPWAIFALLLIFSYNGNLGPKIKYLFYLIYPLHLLLIYGVYRLIARN